DHTVSLGVYFSDPDGNGLEVYYELPRSEWKRERPFTGATQEEKGRFAGPWDEVAASDGAGRDPSLIARPSAARKRRGVTLRSTMSSAPTNSASEPVASPRPASIAS